jgi:hypothetical protein
MKQYKINMLYIIAIFSLMAWLIMFLGTLRHDSHYILIITVASFLIAVLNRNNDMGEIQPRRKKTIPDFKHTPPTPKAMKVDQLTPEEYLQSQINEGIKAPYVYIGAALEALEMKEREHKEKIREIREAIESVPMVTALHFSKEKALAILDKHLDDKGK